MYFSEPEKTSTIANFQALHLFSNKILGSLATPNFRFVKTMSRLSSYASALLLLSLLLLGGCATGVHNTPEVAQGTIHQKSHLQVVGSAAHDVLFRALGLVGVPYRWGGNTPESGFDCSGLIAYVFRDVVGMRLPRTTQEMSHMPAVNVTRENLVAGDLVFFATNGRQRVSHAGIYVGQDRFIHAPSTGGTVRMNSLKEGYWQSNYLSAKRVLAPSLAYNP